MAEALTSVKKAAAVIIALGAERASEVYKYLNEDEIEQISLEIAKLERLSPEEMQSTVEDFYGLCMRCQASPASKGLRMGAREMQ